MIKIRENTNKGLHITVIAFVFTAIACLLGCFECNAEEADVRDAVLNGDIGGYGCDVYSKEPFSDDHPYNDIMKLDNVILTPHMAWGSYEARNRCCSEAVKNIEAFLNGESRNRIV